MIAFHGKESVKAEYLARVRAHAAADEIIHGKYWQEGKGCAVGCTIHGSDHFNYETELGIPAAIAFLEDSVFESLPNGDAKNFPARFLEAIPVGADLSMVVPQFLYWMLSDEAWGLKPESPDVKAAVDAVAECFKRRIAGDEPSEEDWESSVKLARAAWAARDAWDARAAWAAWAARDARAAWAARDAWDAWDARDAWAAWDAWAARDARAAFRKASAEKLLELLANAQVKEATHAK